MTRNDKIALSCLALGTGAIVLTCWITNPVPLGVIDPGWATLVAGLLGFSAIAYQTRVGFKSLRATAAEQSRADREAREHHAELARKAELDRELRTKAALAAALAAELSSAKNQVELRIKILQGNRKPFEERSSLKPSFKSMNELIPEAETVVFKQSAGNLGLLGPHLAYQVVDLYSKLNFRVVGSVDSLVGLQVAESMKQFEEFYEKWLEHHRQVLPLLISASKGTTEE